MNSKRIFYLLVVAIGILFVLIGATAYLGDSALKKKSSDLLEVKAASEAFKAQQTSLAKAQADLKKYKPLSDEARAVVPQDKDQARAVREIINIAQTAKVSITSISFPGSTLSSTSPTAASKQTINISQTKPVKDIPGVYALDMTIQSSPYSATFPQLITFLQGLEQNRRTAQVSNIQIDPDPKSAQEFLTFVINLTIYIKP